MHPASSVRHGWRAANEALTGVRATTRGGIRVATRIAVAERAGWALDPGVVDAGCWVDHGACAVSVIRLFVVLTDMDSTKQATISMAALSWD
jgi:hypothetical protein